MMTNVLWQFLIHTAAMFLAFATFVGLCYIVVDRIVRD
ncbi:hypothetical protein N007_06585 [Alicyclobacillus acidoterrestris ATCC 49025]|nr:hypothetical protein N007_06585 [Alicyclobacillus acidoterrestris ATCC 49025]